MERSRAIRTRCFTRRWNGRDGSLREALDRTVETDLDALLAAEMRPAWPDAFGRRSTDRRSRSADTCRPTSRLRSLHAVAARFARLRISPLDRRSRT